MDSDTLAGNKRLVYVMIKVIKYLTGSPAKSFECKYAVRIVLRNKEPTMDKIGEAIREVINHDTIRGKFGGVHEELRKLGVTKIIIGDNGLNFKGNYHFSFYILF